VVSRERFGDGAVLAFALTDRDVVIDDLPGEGVPERVALRFAVDLDDQLRFDELVEVVLERRLVDAAGVAQDLEGELQPDH